MKKIIITGSTSMLGIALINECIINNTNVIAVIKPNSKNIYRLPSSDLITIVECDLDKINELKKLGKDSYDGFYHFGWEATWRDVRYNPEIQNKNIGYTLNAVRVAKELGCEMFIGAGSQAEYGLVSDVISSDTPVNPLSAYGVAKYAAYKLSSILANDIGIKHVWTRIFSVYGPYDNDGTMISYCLKKLMSGEKPSFTKSEQLWDYLYCGDAARAFYLIGEKGVNQSVYCIGSGVTMPLYEYIMQIRDLVDKNILLGIGDLEYNKNQIMNLCADITSLKRDTEFIPIYSFEDGIKKTIEFLENERSY